MRLVVDTNLWVSLLLTPFSESSQKLKQILSQHTVLMSAQLFEEIRTTLSKEKFARYVTAEEVQEFLARLYPVIEPVSPSISITTCRDAKDSMVLELAVSGKADAILTGDKDLLVLHPFQDIQIFKISDF